MKTKLDLDPDMDTNLDSDLKYNWDLDTDPDMQIILDPTGNGSTSLHVANHLMWIGRAARGDDGCRGGGGGLHHGAGQYRGHS